MPKLKTPHKKNSNEEKKNENCKPANALEFFGKSPVKQSKIEPKKQTITKAELNFHDDDEFEKTLIELDNETLINNASVLVPSSKKSNHNKKTTTPKLSNADDLNLSGIDPDQEMFEKRKQNYASYQRYLNRGQPVHQGQKEYPKVILINKCLFLMNYNILSG